MKRSFYCLLQTLAACQEARKWAGEEEIENLYPYCPRADWMIWLLCQLNMPLQKLFPIVLDMLEDYLKKSKLSHKESYLIKLTNVRRWFNGEIGYETLIKLNIPTPREINCLITAIKCWDKKVCGTTSASCLSDAVYYMTGIVEEMKEMSDFLRSKVSLEEVQKLIEDYK